MLEKTHFYLSVFRLKPVDNLYLARNSVTGRDYLSASLTIHLPLRVENPDHRTSLQRLSLTVSSSDLHLRSTDTSLIMCGSKGPPSTVAGGEKFQVKGFFLLFRVLEWATLSYSPHKDSLPELWSHRDTVGRVWFFCVLAQIDRAEVQIYCCVCLIWETPREGQSQSVVLLIDLHTSTLVE